MKSFYNKLIEKFQSETILDEFIKEGISPPKYIDIYAGQDLDEDNFELFRDNSLFVDWEIDHTSEPPTATITFRLAYEQLRDISNISLNRELGLKFLDYIDQVHKTLNGFESEKTGKLELTKEGFNKMDSIVDIYILEYECSYIRKNPQRNILEGSYDNLRLSGKLKYDL
ncbi:hypothetical protein [Empedobacter brevis]|uniref:hypothetical protein n=1 Tax=Empedobacter brevis TaxID=247 RepID=UPI002899A168|nr:hypothetical protein [Empedobacter brevis]